jgi:hypothetical protein
MTANTSSLRISELDFESIRSNLKEFMKNQSEFSDYDFDGSGLSVLMDILAYNTHYMGYYLNMVGNEMFLDSAQLRSSVVSHAKHIDYLPGSPTGAKATVNIKITPSGTEDNVSTTLTLPKYSTFISTPYQDEVYTFATTEAYSTTKANGSFTFSNILITQGEPSSVVYTVSENRRDFPIPSANVDTDTINVFVQQSIMNSSTEIFTRSDDLTEVLGTSPVFFLDEQDNDYVIRFGDDVIGKSLSNGNIVTINFLDTSGSKANKVNAWATLSSISGYSGNVIVTPVSAAAGGGDRETVEEIRYRATRAYTAQNRAVTVNDYEALLLKDYPFIDTLSVWSGDENDPPVYGKVFVSIKPKIGYEITEVEKLRIVNEIISTRSVLTVFPEIIEPEYTFLLVNATVNYNPSAVNATEAELEELIRQSIIDYKNAELVKFGSTFRLSKLQQAIDNSHGAILGSAVKVQVQKRVPVTLNATRNYNVKFNLPLYKGVIDDKFFSFPEVTVLDNEGITRQVFIEDTPNSLTGIDSIEVLDAGEGYESPPQVVITGDGSGATATARVVNGKIASINVNNRGSEYTVATISFISDSGRRASAKANLQARNGVLRTYYYKTNGEKIIVNSNAGTINYVSGEVNLLNLRPSEVSINNRYPDNVLTLNGVSFDSIITPLRNRIIDIDENDQASISIKMVPEK